MRQLLSEPLARSLDVDSAELTEAHREILARKPMLRSVFRDFYDLCMRIDARDFRGDGLRVEVGAGVSLFKTFYPSVIVTDIKPSAHVDAVVDALAMPFDDGSVRAIFGINCFHHFPDPGQFFRELERVLVPGGGCVLIDPYYGSAARWVYPRLFASEGYDRDQAAWETSTVTGAMSGANQALSYVVFVRDRRDFVERHPGLELVGTRPLRNYPRYVLSGGLNFRQLAPTRAIGLLRVGERLLAPVAEFFGLHQVIVLRRRIGPVV